MAPTPTGIRSALDNLGGRVLIYRERAERAEARATKLEHNLRAVGDLLAA